MDNDPFYSILREKYDADEIRQAVNFLKKFPSLPPKWFLNNEEAKNYHVDLLSDIYKLSRRRRIEKCTKMDENEAMEKVKTDETKSKNIVIRSPYIKEEDKSTYWIPIDVLNTVSQSEKIDYPNSNH
ncbi:unnamed protein product [Heterobilharzia americana]|nr:unnamed protein product [Heterobilharzia americana]CAH8453859.1 unnamed protein product [Heterobilharzia americana]